MSLDKTICKTLERIGLHESYRIALRWEQCSFFGSKGGEALKSCESQISYIKWLRWKNEGKFIEDAKIREGQFGLTVTRIEINSVSYLTPDNVL